MWLVSGYAGYFYESIIQRKKYDSIDILSNFQNWLILVVNFKQAWQQKHFIGTLASFTCYQDEEYAANPMSNISGVVYSEKKIDNIISRNNWMIECVTKLKYFFKIVYTYETLCIDYFKISGCFVQSLL